MEPTQGWVIFSPALSAQRRRDAEEPGALIALARVCGGADWVTSGSTRKTIANFQSKHFAEHSSRYFRWLLLFSPSGHGKKIPLTTPSARFW
jgi:hypothetical protein